jgi:predicted DNA-binding protein
MPSLEKPIRQSVTLPRRLARRVKAMAKSRSLSANRVLVELIESGLSAKEAEKRRFLELAERLTRCKDPDEQVRLKQELARMTFGD